MAELDPVALAGSTITRATLHNQITSQSWNWHGRSGRHLQTGDVIPAVEQVLEKGEGLVWTMPAACPECGARLEKIGPATFCPNRDCPHARLACWSISPAKRSGIDGLGEQTLRTLRDTFGIMTPAGLLGLTGSGWSGLRGSGEEGRQIMQGLDTARTRPLDQVLGALGVEGLGRRSAEA